MAGTFTGLFISLLCWGSLNALLCLVPFSVMLYLYFRFREPSKLPEKTPHLYVRNPSHRTFTVFVAVMMVFFSFEDSLSAYGSFIRLPEDIFRLSLPLSFLALFAGPVITGLWCDKKGPFGTAIFLTLLSQLSLWFIGIGQEHPVYFLIGSALMSFSRSGFLVLLPMLFYALIGERHFLRLYPMTILTAVISQVTAGYISAHSVALWENPGNLLLTLIFLPLFAVFAIFTAWQHRFVLVTPPKR